MKTSLGASPMLFPTPVLLVGTYDDHLRPNLMTAAWGGVCCSSPPCVSVSLRKATYSYAGIVERRAFTIGIPSQAQIKETDYAGIASGRKKDKFAETGLTPVKSDLVDAPYAAEVPVVLECRLIHTLEIGLHTLFVGEILDIKADPAVLTADGRPDLLKISPMVYNPAGKVYHGVGPVLGQAFSIGKR